LRADFENEKFSFDLDDDTQSVAALFYYNMILPFIESYWMTLTYFLSATFNKGQTYDQDSVYSMIQW
jgi:hypothetical protein